MSSVHEMDWLREETVPVSGRSVAQSSIYKLYLTVKQIDNNDNNNKSVFFYFCILVCYLELN